MGFVLALFTAFHLNLAAKNVTTNETYKYEQFAELGEQKYRQAVEYSRNRYLPSFRSARFHSETEDSEPIGQHKIPKNIYNHGIRRNFLEIIFPRSHFEKHG
jgi:hypothetical protein